MAFSHVENAIQVQCTIEAFKQRLSARTLVPNPGTTVRDLFLKSRQDGNAARQHQLRLSLPRHSPSAEHPAPGLLAKEAPRLHVDGVKPPSEPMVLEAADQRAAIAVDLGCEEHSRAIGCAAVARRGALALSQLHREGNTTGCKPFTSQSTLQAGQHSNERVEQLDGGAVERVHMRAALALQTLPGASKPLSMRVGSGRAGPCGPVGPRAACGGAASDLALVGSVAERCREREGKALSTGAANGSDESVSEDLLSDGRVDDVDAVFNGLFSMQLSDTLIYSSTDAV
jgi:hypothetical protein